MFMPHYDKFIRNRYHPGPDPSASPQDDRARRARIFPNPYNAWRPHMTLAGLRPDDLYYDRKPEKPKRDAFSLLAERCEDVSRHDSQQRAGARWETRHAHVLAAGAGGRTAIVATAAQLVDGRSLTRRRRGTTHRRPHGQPVSTRKEAPMNRPGGTFTVTLFRVLSITVPVLRTHDALGPKRVSRGKLERRLLKVAGNVRTRVSNA